MKEHGLENRLLCADLVGVCWVGQTGEPHFEMANIEGISARGASLILEVDLPPGTLVQLRTPRGDYDAAVRDCHHEPDFGFSLHVELINKSRWSQRGFRPRHLFDPRGLERRVAERNRVQ